MGGQSPGPQHRERDVGESGETNWQAGRFDRRGGPGHGVRREPGRDSRLWTSLLGGQPTTREELLAGGVRERGRMGRGAANAFATQSGAKEIFGSNQASAEGSAGLHPVPQ